MEIKTPSYDVGVIIGRFQVPELHQAHEDLIESVLGRHDKVILVLGKSPLPVSRQNPLDFEARKQMIHEVYPDLTIAYAKDQPSDEVWSRKLDGVIEDLVMPGQSVVLYGSRDSFIGHYSGRHPTQELLQEHYISGSEVRRKIAAGRTSNSVDFRRGVVWATAGRFPTPFPTVDVAILNEDYTKLLLGRKRNETLWRFVGGFCEPGEPWEAAARREVQEETHLTITDPQYVGSYPIDDWRYRDEPDGVTTTFFCAKRFSGTPTPDDDIAELRWFDLEPRYGHINHGHRQLYVALLRNLGKDAPLRE